MITKTFSNISDSQWEEIKAALKAKGGFSVDTDSGQLSVKGVKFSWDFTKPDLTITILSVVMADRLLGHNENSIMSDFGNWVSGIK